MTYVPSKLPEWSACALIVVSPVEAGAGTLLADLGLGGEARCQLDLELGLGAAGGNALLDLQEDVVGNILAGTRRRVGAAAARMSNVSTPRASRPMPIRPSPPLWSSWIAAARRRPWNGEIPLDERSNMIPSRYHLVLRRRRIARQLELRLAP